MSLFAAPLDLRKTRLLVTNDDGIHAPGLRSLIRIARALSDDVWIVAPESEHSGASHSLTLRRPLAVHRLGPRKFAISGTPTDCVLLAVNKLIPGKRPGLVLSGINRGANLGEDVLYSGTVAAAMEAAMLGIPAIALSQVRIGETLHWVTAERHGPPVIRRLMSLDWPRGLLVSVNFPPVPPEAVAGIEIGAQGRRLSAVEVVEAQDPFARKVIWIGDFSSDEPAHPATDLGAIARQAIAVTPLHFDLTHRGMLARLRTAFAAPVKGKAKAKGQGKGRRRR